MAVKLLTKLWVATATDLEDIFIREKAIQLLEPEKNPVKALNIYANLYVKYVVLVNNLGNVYDQTRQVQKRKVLENLLQAATGRMLELQNGLKDIEMSEFLYMDGTLIQEKMIPQDVQLLTPYYYPLTRPIEIQHLIEGVRPDKVVDEEPTEEEKRLKLLGIDKVILTPEQQAKEDQRKRIENAINLIKRHEKARQARCLWTNIILHPHLYRPTRPPLNDPNPYVFYHKPDGPMLIQIKTTVYNKDFNQAIKTLSTVQFYKRISLSDCPKTEEMEENYELEEVLSTPEEAVEELVIPLAEDNDEISQEPDKMDELQEAAVDLNLLEEERISHSLRLKSRNEASSKIQRYWLRYRIKKIVKRRKYQQKINLGMIEDRRKNHKEMERIAAVRDARRKRKPEFDAAFVKACEDEKARILKVKGPWIMEDISDHIRAWFWEMYHAGGEFDDYPPAAKGGTILVVRGLTKDKDEFADYCKKKEQNKNLSPEQLKAEAKAIKDKEKAAKDAKKAAKLKEKLKQQQLKQQRAKEPKQWRFNEEDFVTKNFLKLNQGMSDYQSDWHLIDEAANLKEEPIMDWIQIDKYAEAHKELRSIVDQFMRLEYERLKEALCKDKGEKYKAPKPPKEKNRKRKGKKHVPEPPLEQIFDELQDAGVICTYPKIRLDDYVGDISYNNYEYRNFFMKNPMHCMDEDKFVLRSWIFGMGPLIFQKKVKSICIGGPGGTGKKMLAYALCDEMGAVMFNLSPHIVKKFSNDMNGFVKNLLRMSKALMPSVYFIDGAHYPFIVKSTPEEVELNPTLLGSYLTKLMKPIKAEDRIMLIGTTKEPWNGSMAKMKKTYEKMILVPPCDYNTTYLTWKAGLFKKYGVDKTMELSGLTKVTKYYGNRDMYQNCDRVVDIKRRVRLCVKPLTEMELLDGLLYGPPPNFPLNDQEKNKYYKWFLKANKLAKARAKYVADLEAVNAKDKKN